MPNPTSKFPEHLMSAALDALEAIFPGAAILLIAQGETQTQVGCNRTREGGIALAQDFIATASESQSTKPAH